jgi:hypothetical protein
MMMMMMDDYDDGFLELAGQRLQWCWIKLEPVSE